MKSIIFLLIVEENLVNSIVYSPSEEGLQLTGLGSPQDWDGESFPSFKEAVEKSLGKHLSKKAKTKQAIFVVSPFWTVKGEKLTETKSSLLKSLCQEYHWSPGGFVVDDESLVFHFQTAEEIPPSFIALFVWQGGFRLSLVHLGKVKKRLRLSSSQLSPEEIKEGLERLNFEGILPPKFVVWGNIPPGFEEEMVSYPWADKGSLFLHLPEVQLFDWPQLALVFKEVVKVKAQESASLLSQEEEKDVRSSDTALPEGFSFQDLATGEKEKVVKEEEKETTASLSSESVPPERKKFFLKIFPSLPSLRIRFKLPAGILVKAGLASIVLLLILWLWVIKREVILYVTPQQITARQEVVLAAGQSDDQRTLPVREIVVEEEVEGEEVATGTKLIGEKAKGKVTVFNRTSKAVSFPAGSVIVSSAGLEFVFQSEVKVASKTPDLINGVDRWGEAEVEVEAAQIGTRYNLAKDTIFNIKDQPKGEFLVKNKEAFSGGTSREVSAVGEEDVARLKKALLQKAEKKVAEKLAHQGEEKEKLLEETKRLQTVSFQTTKKIGEEGESFGGKLKLRASVLAINSDNLVALAQKILAPQLPTGYHLEADSIQVEFLPKEEKEGRWTGEIVVQGAFYPQLDTQALARQLRAKPKSRLLEEVKKQPRVYRYELNTSPRLFSFFPLLPYREENISVVIGK